MSSWLSDLERRKKEEEQEKQRQEQVQHLQREQEEAQALRLCERYRVQIDFIREQIKPLVARANAVGLIDLKTRQWSWRQIPVHVIEIYYGREVSGHLGIRNYTTDRSISIYLEENGQLKLEYSWAIQYRGKSGFFESGNEHSDDTMPIHSITPSVIEAWVEWVATGKGSCPSPKGKKGFFARLFSNR